MPPYDRWTGEQEEIIIRAVELRISIEDIARLMDRSPRAIIARVLRLNTEGRLEIRRSNDEDDGNLLGDAPPPPTPPRPPESTRNTWNSFRIPLTTDPNDFVDGWLTRHPSAKMEGES